MILVDSSVWIDFFNGVNTTPVQQLDELLSNEIIIIGDLILTEVLQGFHSDKDYNSAKNLFNNLVCYNMLGKDLALKSAENYRLLRKKGITVRKTIDIIIATFCIQNDFVLLHSDRDFDPFEQYLNLQVYH